MKSSTLVVAAVSLLSLASAQPHRRHVHQHEKKDNVVVVVDTVYAQVQAPDVVVYVDQDGNILSTTTQGGDGAPSIFSHAPLQTILPSTSSTPTPSSTFTTSSTTSSSVVSVPTTSVAPVAPVVQAVQEVASSAAPVVSIAAVVSSAIAPIVSSVAPAEKGGYGVAYSPYYASGGCKTQSDINKDISGFVGSYSMVRIYGTSCNQAAMVLSACNTYDMKLFAGVESLDDLSTEIQRIVSAANGDWSRFDTISIGNELVNSGRASPSAVVAAIASARSLLGAANYPGKIVTVDTLVATLAHPTLADNSDYAAVNNHPFFDPNCPAENAGTFLKTSIASLKSKLANPNQEIVITETGWPWSGNANGMAVPSLDNQAKAISAIQSAYSSAVIFLSAYNDKWKSDSGSTFNAEKFWGMKGHDSPTG